jgi:hypothetical protein
VDFDSPAQVGSESTLQIGVVGRVSSPLYSTE